MDCASDGAHAIPTRCAGSTPPARRRGMLAGRSAAAAAADVRALAARVAALEDDLRSAARCISLLEQRVAAEERVAAVADLRAMLFEAEAARRAEDARELRERNAALLRTLRLERAASPRDPQTDAHIAYLTATIASLRFALNAYADVDPARSGANGGGGDSDGDGTSNGSDDSIGGGDSDGYGDGDSDAGDPVFSLTSSTSSMPFCGARLADALDLALAAGVCGAAGAHAGGVCAPWQRSLEQTA